MRYRLGIQLLRIIARISSRELGPRPGHRSGRRSCAARRQGDHGRQGLAHRASRRHQGWTLSRRRRRRGDCPPCRSGHAGGRARGQDRGARLDRYAPASVVRGVERPGCTASRRAQRRRRAEGHCRARCTHRAGQVGDGLVRLAREHPGRGADADAPRARPGLARQSGVHPARRPRHHGELEGAGAGRHHEGHAQPRRRRDRARCQRRGDRRAARKGRLSGAQDPAAASVQHGRAPEDRDAGPQLLRHRRHRRSRHRRAADGALSRGQRGGRDDGAHGCARPRPGQGRRREGDCRMQGPEEQRHAALRRHQIPARRRRRGRAHALALPDRAGRADRTRPIAASCCCRRAARTSMSGP